MKRENDKELENKVIELRKKGYSRDKISKELHIDHNRTQKILEKHNLSGKRGYDLRKIPKKKRVIGKKKFKGKKEKVKRKIVKPKKQKAKEIRKVKREKPSNIEGMKVYGYVKFRIYEGLLVVDQGNIGTNWYSIQSKDEINDAIILVREDARVRLWKNVLSKKKVIYDIYYFLYIRYKNGKSKRVFLTADRGQKL